MISFSEVSLPAGFLIHCLNAATGSFLASRDCRRLEPTLDVVAARAPCPAGHGAGRQSDGSAGDSAVRPAIYPGDPGFKGIRSVAASCGKAADRKHPPEKAPESPISPSIRMPEEHADRSPIAVYPAVASVLVVPDPVPPARAHAQPSVGATSGSGSSAPCCAASGSWASRSGLVGRSLAWRNYDGGSKPFPSPRVLLFLGRLAGQRMV